MPATATATLITVPAATPRKPCPCPTWSAFETLPGGEERLLVAGLRLTEVMAALFPEAVWAVVWHLDTPEARGTG